MAFPNEENEAFSFSNDDVIILTLSQSLKDMCSKIVVLDAGVWLGRVVVTLAIVLLWDAYHYHYTPRPPMLPQPIEKGEDPPQPKETEQDQQQQQQLKQQQQQQQQQQLKQQQQQQQQPRQEEKRLDAPAPKKGAAPTDDNCSDETNNNNNNSARSETTAPATAQEKSKSNTKSNSNSKSKSKSDAKSKKAAPPDPVPPAGANPKGCISSISSININIGVGDEHQESVSSSSLACDTPSSSAAAASTVTIATDPTTTTTARADIQGGATTNTNTTTVTTAANVSFASKRKNNHINTTKTSTKTKHTPSNDADADADADTNADNDDDQNHPGMDGFLHWYEVETSLYRIYTLAAHTTDPSFVAVPPYAPSSRRGRVPIRLQITNRTGSDMNVFWVDYKGHHVPRGRISKRHGVWNQTTWIDHPWVFEDALTQTPVLYYVPYRVIPTIPEAPTIDDDGTTGIHRFALVDNTTDRSSGSGSGNANANANDTFRIGVVDEVFPFPGSLQLNKPLKAIQWNLRHLSRADATSSIVAPLVGTLQKYLVNILNDPGEPKYRNLRIASKHFQPIWELSPLKGLLLAAGFVERGGSCTLGSCDSNKPLPPHRIQEVALLSYLLSQWQRKNENENENEGSEGAGHQQQQPRGADGFGRAGFGRAGTMG